MKTTNKRFLEGMGVGLLISLIPIAGLVCQFRALGYEVGIAPTTSGQASQSLKMSSVNEDAIWICSETGQQIQLPEGSADPFWRRMNGTCGLKVAPISTPPVETRGVISSTVILVGTVAPINTDLFDDSIDLASTSAGPTALQWTNDFMVDTHLEWIGHMWWNYGGNGQVCFIANEITDTSTYYCNE